jgi:AraC family transcriptional regulator
MNIYEILQGILNYIDDNLCEEITADALASKAGYSVWHFCKVFRWGTGCTVMEYVRNRRLLFAAHELNSGDKIIDIAIKYGFETHSGFSKAFRRYFGCSPEESRLTSHYEKPKPPSLSKTKKYLQGGIIMEPKFVTLPSINIAGFVLKTKMEEGENSKSIPEFWQNYLKSGNCERLHGEDFLKSHNEYGACFSENPETGEFEYVIGVEVKEGKTVPAGYETREVPAATYAVFSTPPSDDSTFVQAIQGLWGFIFEEWFPSSGYEYAPNCVDLEIYDERVMTEKGKVCDIYIPVVKK